MKRNPFKVIERVGKIVIGVLTIAAVGLAFGVVVYAVADRYAWGWWALLLVPGVPIGLIVLVLIGVLIRLATDTIHDAWLMAKWRWDDRNHTDA